MHVLVCQECRDFSDERAEGWRGYRIEHPDKTGPPKILFYCPRCAERVFPATRIRREDTRRAEGGE